MLPRICENNLFIYTLYTWRIFNVNYFKYSGNSKTYLMKQNAVETLDPLSWAKYKDNELTN
jgi:hypothetical protein